MLSRKSIDPEKAVEEILDWVYTGKCNSNLEIVENKESDNIDFIIQNKVVQSDEKIIVGAINSALFCGDDSCSDLVADAQHIISSMHSQNPSLEDSSFEEVVLLAEVHSISIFNENCQHEDNILSNASYPVLPCKCINEETACFNCKESEFFKVIDQTHINESFWGKDFLKRRSWFDAHIKIIVPTRRHNTATITEPHGKPKRAWTLEYYLPVGGLKARVCKNSFLSTLDLKTDGRVTEFVRYNTSSDKSPTIDRRGRWERKPEHLVNRVKMREHIESYKPYISHYTRKNAPNRRYLDSELDINIMFNDFKETFSSSTGPTGCYEVYRQVFAAANIGFGSPRQDECDACLVFDAHMEDGHEVENCHICLSQTKHTERYHAAREEYRKPIDEGYTAFTADMQKVVLAPKLPSKEHVFISRLVIFNETFAALTPNEVGGNILILWHEGISGRKADDVTSANVTSEPSMPQNC